MNADIAAAIVSRADAAEYTVVLVAAVFVAWFVWLVWGLVDGGAR